MPVLKASVRLLPSQPFFPLTLSATGAVSELSSVLARAGLSIYYLSTCNDDYILVQEDQVERALVHLRAVFASGTGK